MLMSRKPQSRSRATSSLVLRFLGTTQQARSPCRNETGLLTLGGVSRDCRSLADVLMVTLESICISPALLQEVPSTTYTTVRMVDGVHGNTASLGPAVALDSELVLRTRGLCCNGLACSLTWAVHGLHTQQGLVGTSTTSNDADHATGVAVDNLLGARGKLDPSLALVGVVANNGNVVARRAAKAPSVANLLLHVRHDGTLGNGAQRQDISYSKGCVLAGVDELARVHALVRNEGLGVELEPVRIPEDDAGKRCTPARVMNNLLYDAPDVTRSLGVVERAELGGGLAKAGNLTRRMSVALAGRLRP